MRRFLALALLLGMWGCGGPVGPGSASTTTDPQDCESGNGTSCVPGDTHEDPGPPGVDDPPPTDPGDPPPTDPGDPPPTDPGDPPPTDPGDPPPTDPGDPPPTDPGDPPPTDPGDPPPTDPDPPPPRLVWYQPDPWSAPSLVATTDSLCAGTSAQFSLEGPALDSWRVTASDSLGNELNPYPLDAPASLIPEYLGGGVYSDTGYAVIQGAELPSSAANLTVTVGTEAWSIANTCAAPPIAAAVYPDGPSGTATRISSGDTVCPAPEPWALAVQCPPPSRYLVVVFDFAQSTVTELDETQLTQDPAGWVWMPPLPARGRVDLRLLDAGGLEVDRVVVYVACP